MDEIFGKISKEKDDDFKYKVNVKEVSGNKSYDTMKLLSQTIPFLPNQASIYNI